MRVINKLQEYLIEKQYKTFEEIQNDFKKRKITVTHKPGLIMFKYDVDSWVMEQPMVKYARGHILYFNEGEYNTYDMACLPFDKFENYNCEAADTIDWESARAFEKLDGSIMKLWFNKVKNEWTVSSNASIYIDDAKVIKMSSGSVGEDRNSEKKFIDLFYEGLYNNLVKEHKELSNKEIEKSNIIKQALEQLDKNCTYIFELTSPENLVVIYYKEVMTTLLAVRNNITQEELDNNITLNINEVNVRLETPKEYEVHSLDEAIKLVACLNDGTEKHEGIVIADKNHNRIKVKSKYYFNVHYTSSYELSKANMAKITRLFESGESELKELMDYMKGSRHVIKYYEFLYEELKYKLYNKILGYLFMYMTIAKDKERSKEMFIRISKSEEHSKMIIRCLKSKECQELLESGTCETDKINNLIWGYIDKINFSYFSHFMPAYKDFITNKNY